MPQSPVSQTIFNVEDIESDYPKSTTQAGPSRSPRRTLSSSSSSDKNPSTSEPHTTYAQSQSQNLPESPPQWTQSMNGKTSVHEELLRSGYGYSAETPRDGERDVGRESQACAVLDGHDHRHDDEDDDDGEDGRDLVYRESVRDVMDGEVNEDDEGIEKIAGYATPAQRRALWWKNVIITGCFILSWYTFATLLSVYNKWMFSPQYYGFSYPLFVTFWQMIIQWILAAGIRVTMPQYRLAARPSRQDYVSKILPTAIATGGDIGLSNLSLKTITLSLYTMCKSSSLIFVLGFAFLFHLEKFSLRLLSVISFISLGVFLMVFNITSVSIPGILMVFGASAIGGFRWALTSLLMHTQRMGMTNPFATIYWLAPLMALTLGIVSLIVENWGEILLSEYFVGLRAFKTIGVIALPGGIAFSMVASEYFIIQRAGVVPLSIAGIFKEVTTISISAWIFGDQLTELNIIGVVITILGIALYSYHKYQKTVNSTVPLDSHGNPIDELDIDPVIQERRGSSTATHNADYQAITEGEERRSLGEEQLSPTLTKDGVPLEPLHHHHHVPTQQSTSTSSTTTKSPRMTYPPTVEEIEEDRKQKLRDDFEGWGDFDEDDSEGDEDKDGVEGNLVDDEEVLVRRNERDRARRSGGFGAHSGAGGAKSWGAWWDRPM